MSTILPINIEDLLNHRSVESARVEFKASWDEKTTSHQVIKSICAFANDLQNLNGGYIVIGVAEENGAAVRPVKGITAESLDAVQRWLRGHCNEIDPPYQPVFSPEVVDTRNILVIWVPGSDVRPHKAPDGPKTRKKYYVRIGSESVDAEANGVLPQLLQMTARVPFDDRRSLTARIEDLRESKVREFLNDINSGLLEENNQRELYRKLQISAQVNGHDVPKNIGLLMFSTDPETWFPGARIEIVQFAADGAGNVIEEKVFRGGIHEQLRNALQYLENISSQHLEKRTNSFLVKSWVSYPVQALREALVNAVYHRGYEGTPEPPIKVYLYSDRIEVISYPGPVPGIEEKHLAQLSPMPPVPARNRRIGEFLKELKLAEGRGTGLPKLFKAMRNNGSPEPSFDFDSGRTYFRVTLPAHPEYVAISAMRDAAYMRAIGDQEGAFARIREAWKQRSGSPSLTAELIRLQGMRHDMTEARKCFDEFLSCASDPFIPHVSNVFIEILLNERMNEEAKEILDKLPSFLSSDEACDTAILSRRLGQQAIAHRYFERAGDAVLHNARALLEFAQTKIALAQDVLHKNRDRETNNRLLREARELLERVIRMETETVRQAWAWRELGRIGNWLKHPATEIETAYKNAIRLLPGERRFQDELAKLKERRRR
ncbi:MAG: putative DNA binding domain-containing protein [Magnetococcales bacterium]|nr:putative DNA binding domain-containing protein [Magnetococcales bacterium]MBF0156023.1 putative DNA binding domain-containing protein [Magnetococcales bacterium]